MRHIKSISFELSKIVLFLLAKNQLVLKFARKRNADFKHKFRAEIDLVTTTKTIMHEKKIMHSSFVLVEHCLARFWILKFGFK